MLNATRTLAGVILLALTFSGVVVLLSMVLVTPGRKGTAAVVWTTHWRPDSQAVLFRSALSARDGEAPPVTLGATLYALGSDRQLHALNPLTGSDVAVNAGQGRRVFTFRGSGSRLVMVTRALDPVTGLADSHLVSVDPVTRSVLWDLPLNADVFIDSLQIDSDTAYVGVADNVDGPPWHVLLNRGAAPSLRPRIRAYALSNAALRWEAQLPERSDTGPADDLVLSLVGGQAVATESTRGTPSGIIAIDPASGQISWRDMSGTQTLGAIFGQLIAAAGTDLLLRVTSNGKVIDRLPGPLPARLDASVVSGTSLIWTGSDLVGAIDLVGNRPAWSPVKLGQPAPRATGKTVSRPGVQNGHLYVSGRDDEIYSINAQTGKVEWKFLGVARTAPSPDYAPLRYAGLVLVQDSQLTAYRAPA